MDTRLTATHDTRRLLLATIVALALVMTLGATSASAASPTACRVQNTDTGKTYTALQAAVDAAHAGVTGSPSRVSVSAPRSSTRASSSRASATATSGKPTLRAPGRVRVVVTEKGVGVTLRDLVVTRGMARRGAGILNRGDLTLRDVAVRGNSTEPNDWRGQGPGVFNKGRLRLNGATRIAQNNWWNGTRGDVFNRGTLVMNGSSFIWYLGNRRHAALTMNGSQLPGRGWGGQLLNLGRVTMNDASWVRPPTYPADDSRAVHGVVQLRDVHDERRQLRSGTVATRRRGCSTTGRSR